MYRYVTQIGSHNYGDGKVLLFACINWGTSKASGIVPVEFQRPKKCEGPLA